MPGISSCSEPPTYPHTRTNVHTHTHTQPLYFCPWQPVLPLSYPSLTVCPSPHSPLLRRRPPVPGGALLSVCLPPRLSTGEMHLTTDCTSWLLNNVPIDPSNVHTLFSSSPSPAQTPGSRRQLVQCCYTPVCIQFLHEKNGKLSNGISDYDKRVERIGGNLDLKETIWKHFLVKWRSKTWNIVNLQKCNDESLNIYMCCMNHLRLQSRSMIWINVSQVDASWFQIIHNMLQFI